MKKWTMSILKMDSDKVCICTTEKGEEERTQSRLVVARKTQVCRSIKRSQWMNGWHGQNRKKKKQRG